MTLNTLNAADCPCPTDCNEVGMAIKAMAPINMEKKTTITSDPVRCPWITKRDPYQKARPKIKIRLEKKLI